jgi:arginase
MLTVIGAPFDSAGAGRGEERAPRALREAGLVERLGARDRGDVGPVLRPEGRDSRTGVIALDALVEASNALAEGIRPLVDGDELPLVIGGDCTLLVGVAAGLRGAGVEPALWFADGHADYYDAAGSPTGEAADMDLAILHGDGPDQLADLGARRPLIAPERTVILGHRRPELGEDVAIELDRVPPQVRRFDATRIRQLGPDRVAGEVIEATAAPAWLHLDLDVLDAAALPAVTYPQAEGMGWTELEQLAAPLAASDRLLGVSVADFNPDLDPDRVYAARIVDMLERLLSPRST